MRVQDISLHQILLPNVHVGERDLDVSGRHFAIILMDAGVASTTGRVAGPHERKAIFSTHIGGSLV